MTSKGSESAEQPNTECCMCGDIGFSDQLFQCSVCQFRSQHRYCSNLYPKAESLGTCNWCLSKKEDPKEKSQNSSNSSSSHNRNTHDETKSKKIRNNDNNNNNNSNNSQKTGNRKGRVHNNLQIQNKPIKKPKSPEARSPSSSTSPSVLVSTRKRIITNAALEEKLRRTRSEDFANKNNGPTKHVLRNKVRSPRTRHSEETRMNLWRRTDDQGKNRPQEGGDGKRSRWSTMMQRKQLSTVMKRKRWSTDNGDKEEVQRLAATSQL